jgi:hypothetical protein
MANINWLRLIGGILIGIVVAGATVGAVEWIGHQIYPPPPGLDLGKPEDLARLMDIIPVGAKVAVLIAWFFGSLVGGAVAMQIARNRIAPWIVAAFIVAGGLFSFATIPHPPWMMVGGLALPVLAALLVVRRMRGDSAPS